MSVKWEEISELVVWGDEGDTIDDFTLVQRTPRIDKGRYTRWHCILKKGSVYFVLPCRANEAGYDEVDNMWDHFNDDTEVELEVITWSDVLTYRLMYDFKSVKAIVVALRMLDETLTSLR